MRSYWSRRDGPTSEGDQMKTRRGRRKASRPPLDGAVPEGFENATKNADHPHLARELPAGFTLARYQHERAHGMRKVNSAARTEAMRA